MKSTKHDPPLSAVRLVAPTTYLHPEDSICEAMIDGWQAALTARGVAKSTRMGYLGHVRQLLEHSNAYPWQWTSAHYDDWISDLIANSDCSKSTIRNKSLSIKSFGQYIVSDEYGWPVECHARFGEYPTVIVNKWNVAQHISDIERQPGRREFTRRELLTFFNTIDDHVETIIANGKKGAELAYRDSAMFKTCYAWGFRRKELAMLDITDLRPNSNSPEFGRYAAIRTRYGKASKAGPPRSRIVFSVTPWAVEALQDYVENVRPLINHQSVDALWLSERGTRLSIRAVSERFDKYRELSGIDPQLTLHSLRHSFVTHSIEDGQDETFVQNQVGHSSQSVTSMYTHVGGKFMNKMMRKAVTEALTK